MISNIDTNTITAYSTLILVILTAIYSFVYSFLVYKTLKEGQKQRKIDSIEKKLEKFYYPLKSAISSIHKKEYEDEDAEYLRNIAEAIENALNNEQIKRYIYLSSPRLRELIRKFPSTYYKWKNPDKFNDQIKCYDDLHNSIKKIKNILPEDIAIYEKQLDEYTDSNKNWKHQILSLFKSAKKNVKI